MPLVQSKSKKAFEKNVKTEMEAHPDKENRAQNLAIAYSIKRKNANKKKMAHGGKVEIDAKTEDRPMPDESHADAHDQARSHEKALHDADWTGRPTVEQAQRPSKHALSQPEHRDLLGSDDEDDLMDSIPPGSPEQQPKASYDEEDADSHGPEVSDMEKQHNNHRSPYAEGGQIDSGEGRRLRDREAHLMDSDAPDQGEPESDMIESHDYGKAPNEPDEDSMGMGNPKLEESHKEPHEEMSIAKEIMHKRKMSHGGAMGGYADGGEVDLERNSEEDLNNEDQMSYKAGLKEQYDLSQLKRQPEDSNEHGDDREDSEENILDESDVQAIRRKMKKKAM